MSNRRWSLQTGVPRKNSIRLVSPGPCPLTIPVTEVGRGRFAVCLRATSGIMKNTVFLVTFGKAKEKDVLAKLASRTPGVPRNPHLPALTKIGRLVEGGMKFSLYQSPYYRSGLNRANRRIRSVLQDCISKMNQDDRFYKEPGKVLWPYASRPLMEAIRECAETGRLPASLLHALDLILAATNRGPGQWFLEFQDRNLAQDHNGNLILLDVLGVVNIEVPGHADDDLIFVKGL